MSKEELLSQINQCMPADLQQKYAALIEKRQDETLTDQEYEELLDLTQRFEEHNARRIACLAELARLNGVSLIQQMEMLAPPDENISLELAMRGMDDEDTPEYTMNDVKEKFE